MQSKWIECAAAAAASLLLGLAVAAPAMAQSAYPAKPLRLVIPFPPGGPTDVFGRQYASRLAAVLGQPVVVDNKSGASGVVGTLEVKRSAADGYTLLFGTASTNCLYALLHEKPQYDVLNDFAPIAIVGGASIVFTAHPSLPPTLKGVMDAARAQPGKLQYGSPGAGTLMHISVERLKRDTGADLQHIPFRCSAPSMQALLGGQIGFSVDTLAPSLANHKAGKIRILALASARRSPLAPDVPTVDEALGSKGFEALLWNVVTVPAGTPAAVVDALAQASARVMADASLLEQLAGLGIEAVSGSNPAAAAAYIRAELARWKPVIEASGIKAE